MNAASAPSAANPLGAASVAASFEAAHEITRNHAKNFYYGLRLTPEPRRSALFAIYAWTRTADDTVDEAASPAAAEERLRAFRETTNLALHGSFPTPHAFWPAFAHSVHTYSISRGWIDDLLTGVEGDIRPVQPATEADVDLYCKHVAVSVGRMCLAVWGLRRGADAKTAAALANAVGAGFQRINILRDFATDFDANPSRVYFSRESLAAAQLTPKELRVWGVPSRCDRYVKQQAAAASLQLAAADELAAIIDPDCAPVLTAMASVYRGLLDRIIETPMCVTQRPPISLPPWKKSLIAVRAAARMRLRGLFGAGAGG